MQTQTLEVSARSILRKSHFKLDLLDAEYKFDAESILYQFPNYEEQSILVQGISLVGAN